MQLNSDVLGDWLYTGSCPAFLRCLFRPEPAAFAISLLAAHASYNLYLFRDSANGIFLFRQFTPAPCSPPLGGSDGSSAVRFTPAGKYGGRENWPFGRETRCMSSYPRRAHHKLKWARKVGCYTRAAIFVSYTPGKQRSDWRGNALLPPIPFDAGSVPAAGRFALVIALGRYGFTALNWSK